MSERRDAVNELMQLAKPHADRKRVERNVIFLEGTGLEALLGVLSSGISLRDACAMIDVSYSVIQRKLTEDPMLRPMYEAARIRQAEAVLDEIAEIERKTEHEDLDPKAAAVLIGSKQWRAERLNPRRYGPRSFQHIETVDQTALHLEAVRQLSRERREALAQSNQPDKQQLPALEGEFEVLEPAEVPTSGQDET